MDPLTLAAALATGTLLGVLTGLVPGLHVNTVCAVALAVAPNGGPVFAVGLAAMAVAHAFAAHIPATFLGAPGEETLLSALPAHRMLLEGLGPQAVQVSLDAGLAALALATLLVLPYKWILGEPGGLLSALEPATVWVLGAILLLLVARESRRGLRGMAWAVVILGVSGALGLLSSRLTVSAWVPVAATTLLPLLSGLFGAPALLETIRARPLVPDQQAATRPPLGVRRRATRGTLLGVLAAAATAILPGLTSAVAAALARAGQRDRDPRPVLATLSAVAVAHLVLAFVVLWLALRARTGLAVAVAQLWHVEAWSVGAPPLPLRTLLGACLVAGIGGHLLASALARPAARILPRLPQRPVALAALTGMLVVVVLFSGAWGLALFGMAAAVGLLPLATGLGRIHLTGCLLVPVLLHRLGWG